MTLNCNDCGETLPLGATKCPQCGFEQGIVVTPETAKLTLTTYPPTIELHGTDKASGSIVHRIDAPEARSLKVYANGVESESRHTYGETVSVEVKGSRGVGTPSENRVINVLRACLENEGIGTEDNGKDDARGVDRFLVIAGKPYVVQIVTAPNRPEFWRDASRGAGELSEFWAQAGKVIQESISSKVQKIPECDRANMILVLDANHFGVLSDPPVVASYLKCYGIPMERFMFASVWLVGPTPAQCVRLGKGDI